MLTEILRQKRKDLDGVNAASRIEALRAEVSCLGPTRSLKRSLTEEKTVSMLAEIKRRSPSKGLLAGDLNAGKTARLYEKAGARGISVLTESSFFGGSTDDLTAAGESTRLPVLRKDFILEEFQVWESRAIGADAILLIAAILTPEKLHKLYSTAGRIGLEVLVEAHTEADLREVLSMGPEIVGINNRDLDTFDVKIEITERLRPLVPPDVVCVSESGIRTRDDVVRMEHMGVDAVLVGEEIVRSQDPFRRIRQLLGKTQ